MIEDKNVFAENESFSLTYNFTFNEIALIAKLLRKNQDKLPEGLEHFESAVQNVIYSELSLDQIRGFYEE